jgi:hypothetical protein
MLQAKHEQRPRVKAHERFLMGWNDRLYGAFEPDDDEENAAYADE